MKLNILIVACALIVCSNTCISLASESPIKIMPRAGINGKIETPVKVPVQQVPDPGKSVVKKEKSSLNYSDLDIKKIADEVNAELDDEREDILADLKILWQAAVEKSETIKFAILKLSNPDGEQEKKTAVKKILTPLASVAPLVGAGTGSAIAGSSSILGGGLLGSLLSDDSEINAHLSRVTDADLVVLAQEIDSLQQKLVDLYYNYINSVERLNFADKIVANRYRYYESVQNSAPENIAVADVFYRESLDMQYKARQEVLSTRAALEQFVGNEALIAVDKNIKDRLSSLP